MAKVARPAITITRQRIREQIQLIRSLQRDGSDTALAKRVLRSMLRSLDALRWAEHAEDAWTQPLEGTRFSEGFGTSGKPSPSTPDKAGKNRNH